MSHARSSAQAERKALLVTRAEFDRQRVTLAVHEIKAIVAPPSMTDRVAAARPLAGAMIGLMGPLVGRHRLARWLRIASFALVAVRLARSWQDRPR